MPKLFENAKQIGRKIGLNDDKGYGIAIFLALIIIASIVTTFFVSDVLSPGAEGYSTIYILDDNQRAIDYPEILVIGQNSTFNLWVGVENHNSKPMNYQVQVKITENLSNPPVVGEIVQTYETGVILEDRDWLNKATITKNEPGDYAIVFELYVYNSEGEGIEFSHNYCVLNIRVI